MNSTSHHSPCRLLLGWLLALVYGFSLPGIGPAALGLVALLDCDHQVKVEACGEAFDLVLHHDTAQPRHTHGVLTTLITGIEAHEGKHDHVLHFSASSDTLSFRNEALSVPVPLVLTVPWEYQTFHPAWPANTSVQPYAARPPPLLSATLRCLRTMVILV